MLSNNACLVILNISMWTARRFDRNASKEVADNHGTTVERAGRYNKCLIDTKVPAYRAVQTAMQEARDIHYTMTLPWTQDGANILPGAAFLEYKRRMAVAEEHFRQAVEDFIRAYPALMERARRDLNGLFREADYPRPSEVGSKFGFSITYLPVPDAKDWRVALGEEEERVLRERITQEVQSAEAAAMRVLWARLYEPVKHMAEKLTQPDAIFRDSLVANVQEICGLAPLLNVGQDQGLEAVRQDILAKLANCNAQALREDKGHRAAKAAEADAIARKMKDLMGAFA